MARPIDLDQLMKYPLRRGSALCDEEHADPHFLNGVESVLEWAQTLPTLTPPNEWVRVEERLPEEKQRVIVRCERVGTSVGWILWGRWMTDIGPHAGDVTHWMPLPAPPDKDNHVPAKAPNEPLSILVLDEPDREYIDYICPRCKSIISQRRRGQRMETMYKCKFHDNCGQRVDWSNPQPYRRQPEGEEDT